ncbi:MAG: HesB/IscA family protein [Dehalococcoidia bacterium]
MLTVTATAKEKLKEALQVQATDPEVAIRIIASPSDPNRLELVLDNEREGDQVVESEGGIKVLLVGPDIAPTLEGMVIDHQETPEGAGFTISKLAPDT